MPWNQPNQTQRGQNPYAYRQNTPSPGQQRQFSQGQFPQGQFPQRQFQQGQYQQGQYPQGRYQQGQYQQGQYPQGQYQQGRYPQGQYQQGQIPQGQFPQGQIPQGQIPQGQPQQKQPFRGSLPDGIRMEPLDEKTLKELQGAIGALDSKAAEEEANKIPASGDDKKEAVYDRNQIEMADSLGEFIQNERNAVIFYRHLSGLARNDRNRKALEEICEDSQSRKQLLNELYRKHKGKDFDMKNSAINTMVGLYDGIELAIREESKALKGLCQVYEKANDEKTGRIINSILYRKISDLSILHLLQNILE